MPPGKSKRVYTQKDWDVHLWPEPGPGVEYGPTEMQEKLFIYHQEPWERPHFHNVDVVLLVGGKGGGKTLMGIAEIIELVLSYKKCAAIVAGVDMPMLKRNVMDLFGERLSWTDPDGIEHPWEHPAVVKPPPEKTPVAPLYNGSTIRFLGIDKDQKVRGFTADVFMIEEVNLLSANSLKEMFSRSRGKALPVRQFILNMNPSGRQDWIDDMFGLKQLRKGYDGDKKTHGEICKCQFCTTCLDRGIGEFEWVGGNRKIGPNGLFYEWEGGECPNPDCPVRLQNIAKGRPPEGKKKTNLCPGNQNFYRVIQSASFDNPHLPSDFVQLQRGALSKEEFDAFVGGEIIDLNTGVIYKEFSSSNIKEVEFDPDRDILWTMDFNFDPMCSLVCQESKEGINVVDEFTIWNADELDVAKAFAKRYRGFEGKVILYGDPNGILVTSRADSSKTSFKVIYDFLKLNGFKVEMGISKVKGDTLIPIITRVNTLKAAIKSVDGTARVFVNPKCTNLIESLYSSKWKEKSSSPKEDDGCDEVAKKNPKRYEEAVTMTHPQAALGYLIYRIKPLLFPKKGVNIMLTGDTTIVSDAKEVKVAKREIPAPVVELPEVEEFSLGAALGWTGSTILRERLEYERKQREGS